MDTDLRDDIDRCLGAAPPLVETDLVTSGRTALRRRRLTEVVASVTAVAAVACGGVLLSGGGSGGSSIGPAGSPTSSPTDAPTPVDGASTVDAFTCRWPDDDATFTITVTDVPGLPAP